MIEKITTRKLFEKLSQDEKKRKDIREEHKQIKKKYKPDSKEFNAENERLKKIWPADVILEEDCRNVVSGGLKRGKALDLESVGKLIDFGYEIIWINQGDKIPAYKEFAEIQNHQTEKFELAERVLGKAFSPFNEAEIKKHNSTIKLLDGDDLTKNTINALQNEGAMLIAEERFGKNNQSVLSLSTAVRSFLKGKPKKIVLGTNINMGNRHIAQESESRSSSEPSNFHLNNCLYSGFLFGLILNSINEKRLTRTIKLENDSNKGIIPRLPYPEELFTESVRAAFFLDFGFVHGVIDRNIFKSYQPLISETSTKIGTGILEINPDTLNYFDRHANVSKNIMCSNRGEDRVFKEISEIILHYHHRALHGGGYPKRQIVQEKIYTTDGEGVSRSEIVTVFDQPIHELTRLAGVINIFLEYLHGTPWRLPFERDSLVRYFKLNSQYGKNPDGSIDIDGNYDINTKQILEKRFDAHLVDMFLEHIILFRIGEKVPVYSFNDPTSIRYQAIVIAHGKEPHRPVLQYEQGDEAHEVDLADPQNEMLFIGENHPSLKFKFVLQQVCPEFANLGINIPEDLNRQREGGGEMRTEEQEVVYQQQASEISNLFAEAEAPSLDLSAEVDPDFDINAFIAASAGGIAPVSTPKEAPKTPESVDAKTNINQVSENDLHESNEPGFGMDLDFKLTDFEEKESSPIQDADLKTKTKIDSSEIKGEDVFSLDDFGDEGLFGSIDIEKGDQKQSEINIDFNKEKTIFENDFSFQELVPHEVVATSAIKSEDYLGILDEELMLIDKKDIVYVHYLPAVHKQGKSIEELSEKEAKGEIRYLGLIQEMGKEPKILLLRYVQDENIKGPINTIDENCGRVIDCQITPFFKPGRMLTAKELIDFFEIKIA